MSNWWDLAACRGSDPSRWVPEKDRGADYEETRQICAECIVSAECLAHGMAHREIGIWGGTNTNERDRIRRSKS